MRKEMYRMERERAIALFARANVVRVAAVDEVGAPLLKTVHGVVVDGALAFHGAPAGEKAAAIGRPCVVAAEEVVAPIPSWFVDEERACPATTYYLSAQAHGTLERVDEPEAKARVLAALMAKLQPEGRHVPVDADHPLYRKAVQGILIVRVALDRVDGKAKLGQNRAPDELRRIVELLWARGAAGDARAIESIREANPRVEPPAFLRAPDGARLSCAMEERDLDALTPQLAAQYWNEGVPWRTIARAHSSSTAWVGARDERGCAFASARAMADGKRAWIYDVVVAPAWRGRGLGRAVVRLLLDHPSVRGARETLLATRDAQPFYRAFGFVDRARLPPKSYSSTEMVRLSI